MTEDYRFRLEGGFCTVRAEALTWIQGLAPIVGLGAAASLLLCIPCGGTVRTAAVILCLALWLVALALGAYWYLLTESRKWTIGQQEITIESGVLGRTIDVTLLYRVCDLRIRQGFVERIFGMAMLEVCSTDVTARWSSIGLMKLDRARYIKEMIMHRAMEERQRLGIVEMANR